jgi:predicted DNA-binding transcriptional regulator AlpA
MKKLLTTREAAELLGHGVQTLCNWRVQGCGPRFVKFGHRVGYREEDIDAFVARNIRTSTSETEAA